MLWTSHISMFYGWEITCILIQLDKKRFPLSKLPVYGKSTCHKLIYQNVVEVLYFYSLNCEFSSLRPLN